MLGRPRKKRRKESLPASSSVNNNNSSSKISTDRTLQISHFSSVPQQPVTPGLCHTCNEVGCLCPSSSWTTTPGKGLGHADTSHWYQNHHNHHGYPHSDMSTWSPAPLGYDCSTATPTVTTYQNPIVLSISTVNNNNNNSHTNNNNLTSHHHNSTSTFVAYPHPSPDGFKPSDIFHLDSSIHCPPTTSQHEVHASSSSSSSMTQDNHSQYFLHHHHHQHHEPTGHTNSYDLHPPHHHHHPLQTHYDVVHDPFGQPHWHSPANSSVHINTTPVWHFTDSVPPNFPACPSPTAEFSDFTTPEANASYSASSEYWQNSQNPQF